MTVARAFLLAVLAVWSWQFATHPLNAAYVGDSFLHLINLPFHEAGHIFFAPFGSFMMSLGGSLTQVLIPVVCTVAFVRKPDLFGAAVAAWWAGQNLVDLGPYIADARALSIVLLGGRTGAEVEGHDWEAILTALGLMHRDRQIGMMAHMLGSAVMALSIATAAWITWRDSRLPSRSDSRLPSRSDSRRPPRSDSRRPRRSDSRRPPRSESTLNRL